VSIQSSSLVAIRVAIPVLSVGVYLGSFAAPSDFYPGWRGFQLFLAGLLCCWAIHLTFSWWANVLYVIALGYYCRGDQALAARWALVASGLAMSWGVLNPSEFNAPAYPLWSGSIAALAVGSLAIARSLQQKSAELRDPNEHED
jgi:hypothetical protein